jgi:group I intron endonuclease
VVIYKTTNLINGKFYVGKDARNLNCYLGSGKLLKKAIKKYGKNNFVKEILEVCDNLIDLEEREKYWIKELDSIKNGYNLTEGGTGGNTFTNNSNKEEIRDKLKNRKHTEETKRKISENNWQKNNLGSRTGTKWSEEQRFKMDEYWSNNTSPMKGKKHTEESKQSNRDKHLGKKMSEETRVKMSLVKKGKSMERHICPYCGKEGGGNVMKQWHFENCKKK